MNRPLIIRASPCVSNSPWTTPGRGVDGGLAVRIALAKNAIQALRDHPGTGVGAGLLANYSSVD